MKVQRWLSHEEYSLKESTTALSVEVLYAGGAVDAWLCESDVERKTLLALTQQLPLKGSTTAPLTAIPAPSNRHKRDVVNNGSRSLSLRNVRMLLEKDSVASQASNNGGGSALHNSSMLSAVPQHLAPPGATNNNPLRASLRVEAENAELAAMRLKLLEWRSLVDQQGVDLANERKMRIALEQKVNSLMQEVCGSLCSPPFIVIQLSSPIVGA